MPIMQLQTEVKVTNLVYNPVIQGFPTEMNTIYTGIKNKNVRTSYTSNNIRPVAVHNCPKGET